MQYQIKTFFLSILFMSLTSCLGVKDSKLPLKNSLIVNSSIVKPTNSLNSSFTVIPITPVTNESTQKLLVSKEYLVGSIFNCGEELKNDIKTFSIFDGYDYYAKNQNLSSLNFSGWNHATNANATEWGNLKLASRNYNFSNEAKINNSCTNLPTLDMVLVKKIADWNRQHVNGFECNILAKGYKFGDIESLVFELKINKEKTNISNVESLKNIYGSYTNESTVDEIEDGKVNIGITLSDNTNLNGSIIFQLDQVILYDKWVRVTIPMSKLSFYKEIDYNKTTKNLDDLKNVVINRMLIVGETKSGGVLRGEITNWNTNVPETFKEIDVSFKKIAFQLK